MHVHAELAPELDRGPGLGAGAAQVAGIISAGSSGEILTNETREIYRRRRQDLLEDIEEAKENNDLGRAEKLQVEIEFLNRELAGAAGLGGRAREKSDIERIRKSVSGAVSRAIDAIAADHEPLGRHLTVSIKSGLTFRYDPERDPNWLT